MDPITALMAAGSAVTGIKGMVKNKRDKKRLKNNPSINMPTMTGDQKGLADMLGQLGGQGVQQMAPNMTGSPFEGFQPLADQARMNFNQQGIPGLAEQFTSMGEGAQRSSAFPQALGQTSRDFERGLSGEQMNYGFNRQGQQQNLLSLLSGQGLKQQQEPVYEEKQANPWAQLGGTAMSTLLNQYIGK